MKLTDYITEHEEFLKREKLVVDHLLDSYTTLYWVYLHDKDSIEAYKTEAVGCYIIDLTSIERTISYHSVGDTGPNLCKYIRDSLYAKHRIANEMDGKEHRKPIF